MFNDKIKKNQDDLLSNITDFLKKEYNVIESTVQLFSTMNSKTCDI